MELLTYPGNKNAFKCLIAAEYVGVKINVPPFQMGVDNKTPDFLKKNPFGKVPVLCTESGGALFESNAIARYVASLKDVGLCGSTVEEHARIEQWIDFSSMEIDAPCCSWVFPLIAPEIFPYDKKKEKGAQDALQNVFGVLNAYLQDKTYLVKDSITLADIILICSLYLGFKNVCDEAFLKPFPHLRRYYLTLVNQPAFKKVMGEHELCTTPLKYTPPKKQETKPVKEEAPKEKPKTWLDLLPPTPMPFDAFKRLYSNSPAQSFRETFLPRMWDGGPIPNSPTDEVFPGMDTNGYSFWFATYKYDDENTVDFMVSNKVGGFLQRMEFARKFAFGILLILKSEEKKIFPIRGLWIFRGPEIPKVVVDESDDMALYDLTKADLTDPDQKKRVEDILCEDTKIDDMEIADSKVFK